MRKDLAQFIKDVRAARRKAEILDGTLMRHRASTVPDLKKKANKEAARYRAGARKWDDE